MDRTRHSPGPFLGRTLSQGGSGSCRPHLGHVVAGYCLHRPEESLHQDGRGGAASGHLRGASTVYVWLAGIPTHAMEQSFTFLKEFDDRFHDASSSPNPNRRTQQHHVLGHLKRALPTLFDDRWFSSLWTLQEAVISSTAIFLSRSGEVAINHVHAHASSLPPLKRPFDLHFLSQICGLIMGQIVSLDHDDYPVAVRCAQLMDRSAMTALGFAFQESGLESTTARGQHCVERGYSSLRRCGVMPLQRSGRRRAAHVQR